MPMSYFSESEAKVCASYYDMLCRAAYASMYSACVHAADEASPPGRSAVASTRRVLCPGAVADQER
jgi:hypothetical protein